jgi:hypothetical protein
MLNVGGEIGNADLWDFLPHVFAYMTMGSWIFVIVITILALRKRLFNQRISCLLVGWAIMGAPLFLFALSGILDRNLRPPM